MATTLPPGPRSILPQLLHMQDPFPYMLKIAKDYSDPLSCPIPGRDPMVITWGAEGAKAVFSADPDTFAPGAAEALAVIVGSGSLFIAQGAKHKRSRKMLTPPFHGERMRSYATIMRDAALRWGAKIKPNTSAPMLETAQGITLDIIIEAIFGEQDPSKVAELHSEILGIVAAFNPLFATFSFFQKSWFGPWKRFQERASAMRATMKALINSKRERPGDDILSLLVSARDEEGQPLDEGEIMDQLLTFVVAGHETTATTLAWAMYELHRAPETLSKLRSEIASLGASPAIDALAKLPYLQAVCSETLRLHPPLPMVPRTLLKDFKLGEYTLPAGRTIAVAIYMAHHNEERFPDSFVFRPERFVGQSYGPFEFMPFGGGVRRCLGAAFAMYELEIVLGTLVTLGEFTLDEKKPVGNEFRIGTYGPAKGIRMTLKG